MTSNSENSAAKFKDIDLYPVLVKDYEKYLPAKAAWAQRQTFLPVKFVLMPFLQALFAYAVDKDAVNSPDAPKGAFVGLLQMLCLVCRLKETPEELLRNGLKVRSDNGRLSLVGIEFSQDGQKKYIPAEDFPAVRAIVAGQNGIELPNEKENPEILRAYRLKIEKENEKAKRKEVKFNLDDLIESIAYLSGLRYGDLLTWTVKEFERRKRAIDRAEDYRAYRTAEMGGMISFKDGNPVPSLYFDSIDDKYGTSTLKEANLERASSQIEAASEQAAQPQKSNL